MSSARAPRSQAGGSGRDAGGRAQGFDVSGGLDVQVVPVAERQAHRQRQNLVPVAIQPGRVGVASGARPLVSEEAPEVVAHRVDGLARVHVEQDDDAAVAVGRRRRRMDATGERGAEIEQAVRIDHELVALPVVVAEPVLAAAHVAEEHQDVPVADRPEIRACAVIPQHREPVALDEGVEVLPVFQVPRAEEELGGDVLAFGSEGNDTGGQSVVRAVLRPDAGIEDPVGRSASPSSPNGITGLPVSFSQFSSSGSRDTATMLPTPTPW